jgi:hypothetical protein
MFEDAPARGIRQRRKRPAQQSRRTFNHMVNYCLKPPGTQEKVFEKFCEGNDPDNAFQTLFP